jgi:hypothetical protein
LESDGGSSIGGENPQEGTDKEDIHLSIRHIRDE